MGQQDTYKLLETPKTVTELMKITGVSRNSINSNLKKLKKSGQAVSEKVKSPSKKNTIWEKRWSRI